MGYPRALPDYTVGTVTVTAGSRNVTGAGTLWQDGAGEYQIFGGDMLRVGNQRPVVIESIQSATGLTLVEPWPHATAAGTAYRAIRYVPLPSSQVVWAINQVLALLGNGWVTPAKLSAGRPFWDTSGNVGVGTNSPSQRLDVNGNVKANNLLLQSYFAIYPSATYTTMSWEESSYIGYNVSPKRIDFTVTGGATSVFVNANGIGGPGGQLTGVSDRRVKSDIAPIGAAQAESTVMGLPALTFTMDGKLRHGFIADEVAQYLPEIVLGEPNAVNSDTGEPILQGLALDQTPLIAALWAHVQALTLRVRALEAAT